MTAFALETEGLSYQFSRGVPVIDSVGLRVPAGSIYGFLGPNGAGKTTTLRLVLGLLRLQRGRISLFGRSPGVARATVMRRVGSLIETPSIYVHLTAEDNLEVWRKLYGCSRDRIDIVLEAVGLAAVGAKRAGRFSLGMKQRLGIAVALLHAPELLILDEPTNGLDPGGIVEVRELLLRLNREHGVTIVVSSHLLWEMQKLVTHTGIIHQGRLLYQGPLAGLVGSPASAETSAGEAGEAGDGDLESIFIKLTQNNKKR